MPLGSLLGPLEALLGGLWTQKRVKTVGVLRFWKRLFEAPDGPLGLILAHSGQKLSPKLGPKRVPKLAEDGTISQSIWV